jgi:hypothetical protein
VGVAVSLPYVRAAEEGGQVTQIELARLLVSMTGLSDNLSSNPTASEMFAALMASGIAPGDGWKGDQIVTRADLARVVVQAIGDASEVSNPDDPKAWIDYLKSIGVPIDTIGQAVGNAPIKGEMTAVNPAFGSTTDPINRPGPRRLPDSDQFGTDVTDPVGVNIEVSGATLAAVAVTIHEVIQVLTEVTQRDRVSSSEVTPNEVKLRVKVK